MVKVLLLTMLSLSIAGEIKCRGLAMAGGGAYGAYEAGAFDAFVNTLPAEEVMYNIVSGVSAGSLNTATLGMFRNGDEQTANNFLNQFWFNLTSAETYNIKWPILYNVFFGNSILDNTPMRNTIHKYAGELGIHRPITVGTTNLNTGEFVNFNSTSLDFEDIIEAVICSASIPMAFPPQQFKNDTYVDGGVINNIDIAATVDYCQNLGFEDEDIIIDAFFDHGGSRLAESDSEFNYVWNVYNRMKEIEKWDSQFRYIERMFLEFPRVNFRYFIRPTQQIKGSSMDFSHDSIVERLAFGKNDTMYQLEHSSPEGNARAVYEQMKVEYTA